MRTRSRELTQRRENPRYLPGIRLADGVHPVLLDLARQSPEADLIALALPAAAYAETSAALEPRPDALVITLAKGLDPVAHRLLSDVVIDATGHDAARVAPLSGPEPRRGDRRRPAGGERHREHGRRGGVRPPAGTLDDPLPRLRVGGRPRRAALRRCQERDRDRRGDLGRTRVRRQRARRPDHARPRRDDAARLGARRRSPHLRGPCGAGRPRRHLYLEALAQPGRRRAARARERSGCRGARGRHGRGRAA